MLLVALIKVNLTVLNAPGEDTFNVRWKKLFRPTSLSGLPRGTGRTLPMGEVHLPA
jgi:hypothetical protein